MPKDQPETDASLPAKRVRGQPAHAPTKLDRDTVKVMVAGGITQADIARSRGISLPTLRKHYRAELDNGATELNTMVIVEHIKAIKRGDFAAIKWWEQARMGWRGDAGDADGRLPDQSMRVVVEFVGEPAAPTLDHAPLRPDDRESRDALRKHVQLIG